jgi:MFS family permease
LPFVWIVKLPAKQSDPSVPVVAASLIAGVFFSGMAGGVAFPTLPRLGPVLGISPFLVGLILAINRMTRLVMNTPAGSILDRFGTRKPMLIGFGLMPLAPFGYILGLNPGPVPLSSARIFLLSRGIWGVGSAFVFVGAFSTITHVTTPDNRGRWTGYMRGGQSMGFPTGLVVGGLVTDAFGYAQAFAVAGVAGILAMVVAFLVIPNVNADVGQAGGIRAIPGMIQRDPRIGTVGFVNFAVRFLFAGVLLSTVVLYAETFGIRIPGVSEVGVSGMVMAASVVASSSATVVAGRYSDALSNRALVTVPALGLLALGFVLLVFVPTLVGSVLGVVLIGFGVGGSNPPLLAYLGDISPSGDVGKLGGVYNVFGDVGSSLGPIVAIPAVHIIGFRVGYLLCAGLVIIAAALVAATLFGAPPTPVKGIGAPADD